MGKPELLDFNKERIRVLHYTWIAFFITFFVWFNMAPMATTMLDSIDWLTKDHIKILAISNVALTIPARIIIGALIDRYGPKKVFSGLMIVMAIPALTFAFGNTFGLGSDAWRYALALNGLVSLIYGFIYYFIVNDNPPGKKVKLAKKTEPMKVSSYGDLIQYLVWSFPLVGAMGVLAWKIGKVNVNGMPILTPGLLTGVYVLLAIVYVAHVVKVLQVNIPYLKKGVPENEKYSWSSVAALNTTYFANFGAELAVVSMLPMFFENVFRNLTNATGDTMMNAAFAGILAASFAFVNLFARPLGGLLSDMMKNRKKTMLMYMLGITLGFLGMALIGKYGPVVDGIQLIDPTFDGVWWLGMAVLITVFCSLFVQGAEGATFAVIPMIKKNMTGQIAGMAGAYGNVGAVIYLVIYSIVDAKTFFFIISGGAFISFIFCFIFLKEPEGSFDEEH